MKGQFRVIPTIPTQNKILHAYYDEIEHCDKEATLRFVSIRFWWPTMYHEIHKYVKSCDICQIFAPSPKYKSSLRTHISSLLDVFSIYFVGTLPVTKIRNLYVLVALEHLIGWPITHAIKDATADGHDQESSEKEGTC